MDHLRVHSYNARGHVEFVLNDCSEKTPNVMIRSWPSQSRSHITENPVGLRLIVSSLGGIAGMTQFENNKFIIEQQKPSSTFKSLHRVIQQPLGWDLICVALERWITHFSNVERRIKWPNICTLCSTGLCRIPYNVNSMIWNSHVYWRPSRSRRICIRANQCSDFHSKNVFLTSITG